MKVVLDTNILFSGTFWKGNSSRIVELIDSGRVELVLSQKIIEEYNVVINREEIMNKIKDKDLILNKSIQKVIEDSILVDPSQKFNEVKDDPDDNIILEYAIEGNVDYILSQDKHLLKLKEFKNIKIISPEEFLKIFEN